MNEAVSIHAPRMGRDKKAVQALLADKFQFTRPAWGATRRNEAVKTRNLFQFTRPAWGATHAPLDQDSRD